MQASRLDVNGEPETRFGGGELKLACDDAKYGAQMRG
jgi:hypothetical protein